jgi:hypothetical protein
VVNYARANLWARRGLDLAATLDWAGAPTSPAAYKALLARGHARLHGKVGESGGEQEIARAGIRDEYETLELGLRQALPEVVQLAYNFLLRGLLEVGRDAEAATLIDAADEYARRSGVAAIGDTRGYSLLFAGRWAEGITAMRDAVATSRAIGSPGKLALELTALGHLLVAQGDGPGATEVLEEALAILEPSGQWVILAPCLHRSGPRAGAPGRPRWRGRPLRARPRAVAVHTGSRDRGAGAARRLPLPRGP